MTGFTTFRCFFSYAHHDQATDPAMVTALTQELELRVNANLANARFEIWQDTHQLRTGARWNDRIEAALRASDMMIVLLSPRWIESEYCRKEYLIFEEVERQVAVGEYVAPLMARSLTTQEPHLDANQREVLQSLMQRQYHRLIATEFLQLTASQRAVTIDRIADDLLAMIERRRILPPSSLGRGAGRSVTTRPARRRKPEFSPLPINYEQVDPVIALDLILRPDSGGGCGGEDIYAQVEFHERLFIETRKARVDFSIRRAHLTIFSPEGETLTPCDDFGRTPNTNVFYVTRRDMPDALCLSIQPPSGREGLGHLTLPVTAGENRLARVGSASPDHPGGTIKGELSYTLSTTDIYILGSSLSHLSHQTRMQLEHIIEIALQKHVGMTDRTVRKPVVSMAGDA